MKNTVYQLFIKFAGPYEKTHLTRNCNFMYTRAQCLVSGSTLIGLSWIRIQEQGKWQKLTNKPDFPSFKLAFIFSYRIRTDPQGFGSLDPDLDTHWGKKLDPDPYWNHSGSENCTCTVNDFLLSTERWGKKENKKNTREVRKIGTVTRGRIAPGISHLILTFRKCNR